MQGIVQKLLANPEQYSVQQLQRGVQDGVIPAYIGVPLLQEKIKRQQEAQATQAGSQAGLPSIAEQVMNEAQQARGVEALPTNLPTDYAHGGIVAFADGGDVERFADGDLVIPNADPWYANAQRSSLLNYLQDRMMAETDPIKRSALARAAQQYIGPAPPPVQTPDRPVELTPQGKALQEQMFSGERGAIPQDQLKTMAQAVMYGAKVNAPAAPAAPAAAAVKGPGQKPPLVPTGATATKGVPPLPTGMQLPTSDLVGTATAQMANYQKRADARQQQLDKQIADAQGQVTGKPFEGLQKSLEDEAKQYGADKEQAKYMSLFKAGLAMMAGTSQHPLENIGKGAMVGADDYQAASKDIRQALKQNQIMQANVEQARRAEAIGNRDKAIDRMDKAMEAANTRDQLGVQAIVNATGKSAELAQKNWGDYLQYSGQIGAAQIHTAGMLGAAAERVAGQGVGRGAMTAKQVGDALQQLETHPDTVAFKNALIAKYGKNAVNQPAFKAEMQRFVQGLYQKYYGGGMGVQAPSIAPEDAQYFQ